MVWPRNKGARKVRILQKHAVYGAMVEAMDLAVGKVLDKLKSLGLDDEVVVAFTSDNGGLSTSEGSPTSNLPLRGGKGWLYEGGIREPFLVRWPGVTEPGSQSSHPVMSTDFFHHLRQSGRRRAERRRSHRWRRSYAPAERRKKAWNVKPFTGTTLTTATKEVFREPPYEWETGS